MPLASEEEINHAGIRALLDNLDDRISTVEKATVRPINQPNSGFGSDNTRQPGRERRFVGGYGHLHHPSNSTEMVRCHRL